MFALRNGATALRSSFSKSNVLVSRTAAKSRFAPHLSPGPAAVSLKFRLFSSPSAKNGADEASDSHSSRMTLEEQTEFLMTVPQSKIRNFSIIAHVDHGKSTLADRLLEMSGNIMPLRQEDAQCLDRLQVERERGITVKAQTASMFYRNPADGEKYLLNLIDTPGHVDFSYEVSRSLAACQGALLLVDASQGIQAQTVANFFLAAGMDLDIIPLMTKLDLPHADPPGVALQMENAFGCNKDNILAVSSKSGLGVNEIFPRIVSEIKAPSGDPEAPLRALLFDSWFDQHRGVVCLINVIDGQVKKGDRVATYHGNQMYEVQEVGLLMPHNVPTPSLNTGQVGYVIAHMKTTREARLGDTFYYMGRATERIQKSAKVITAAREKVEPLDGFQPAKSMVFAGLFPGADSDFEGLRMAVEKLTLNDPSVSVANENSVALGQGFRCGFLGVLHMDVFKERLEKEFGAQVIITAPTVPYTAELLKGDTVKIESPAAFPDPYIVKTFYEPMVTASIICVESQTGAMMELCGAYRGELEDITHFSSTRVCLKYKMPLAEIVTDFYDQVKSVSSGYASFDYEENGTQEANLVKLDIKLNGDSVDALSVVCIKEKADFLGRQIAQKLKELVDRQNFEIIIQAAVGSKIIARERLAPYRKDVLIKSGKTVGGGDSTRKEKLLAKQREGKKRMKMVGNVELKEDVFMEVMKLSKHET